MVTANSPFAPPRITSVKKMLFERTNATKLLSVRGDQRTLDKLSGLEVVKLKTVCKTVS